jgi:hypothetical protein
MPLPGYIILAVILISLTLEFLIWKIKITIAASQEALQVDCKVPSTMSFMWHNDPMSSINIFSLSVIVRLWTQPKAIVKSEYCWRKRDPGKLDSTTFFCSCISSIWNFLIPDINKGFYLK